MVFRKSFVFVMLIAGTTCSCADARKTSQRANPQQDRILDEILSSQDKAPPFMVSFGMPIFLPDENLKGLILRYGKEGTSGIKVAENRVACGKLNNWEIILMVEVISAMEGTEATSALERMHDRIKSEKRVRKHGQYPGDGEVVKYIELKRRARKR